MSAIYNKQITGKKFEKIFIFDPARFLEKKKTYFLIKTSSGATNLKLSIELNLSPGISRISPQNWMQKKFRFYIWFRTLPWQKKRLATFFSRASRFPKKTHFFLSFFLRFNLKKSRKTLPVELKIKKFAEKSCMARHWTENI